MVGTSHLSPTLLTLRADALHGWTATQGWILSLQTFMVSNWMAFGLGQTLIAMSGVLPASAIAIMSGATLGFGWGFLLSAVSTMLGGWIAFALSRSVFRGWIARWLRNRSVMTRLDEAMAAEGWRMVALLRVSPVMPFALTSYGLGLTRLSHRDFLIGTLASLPALAGYVAVGALGRQSMLVTASGAGNWQLFEILVGIVMVLYALVRVRKAVTCVIAKAPTPS